MKSLLFLLVLCGTILVSAHADTPDLSTYAKSELLSPLPVKITKITKQKDDTAIIDAQFESYNSVGWYTFLLPVDVEKESFFKREGDHQEEIDRNKFIKIAKNNYWMLWFDAANVVQKAFQFKNWAELEAWYPSDPDNAEMSVHSVTYWEAIKTQTLYFYDADFTKDVFYWKKVEVDDKPLSAEEEREVALLEKTITELTKTTPNPLIKDVATSLNWEVSKVNRLLGVSRIIAVDGRAVYRRLKFIDGTPAIVKSIGTFKMHPKCIFNIIEIKSTKGLLSLPIISSSRMLLKPILIKKSYFEENFSKVPWVCVFNKHTMTLLRASPLTPDNPKEK